MRCSISDQRGQSTVEAAFLLPVLFLVLGLLVQPSILLYDRCVMQVAAAETCRLVATSSSDAQAVKAYAQRRLSAIPTIDAFHVDGSDWDIQVQGGEWGDVAQVTITNRCRHLPLLGITAGLAGSLEGDGLVRISVTAASSSTPSWVSAAGLSPDDCIAQWD